MDSNRFVLVCLSLSKKEGYFSSQVSSSKRLRIDVKGRVQGVGFRPVVYRYAKERGLSGWVSNTSEGVVIEVEGDSEEIDDFLKTLKAFPPRQAKITALSTYLLPVKNEGQFSILPSIAKAKIRTQVSPDIATCPECLKELLDPTNRRYLYPFINCTNCGPRFTIVKSIPYDRDKTTMGNFAMCPQCQEEYNDPLNRRFHAQPNACPQCGPQVTLVHNSGATQSSGPEAVRETIRLLREGKIIAIKGLGGFHLACDATNDRAVGDLRGRKYRENKPFALMASNLETVRKYCEVSPEEEELLISWKRPIVLLKKKPFSPISEKVAPNNSYLGFMLPYTPLHYLLFQESLAVLVMTSGNISDEPIAYENKEAMSRLKGIADYFLLHDRDIYIRCDDSVTRIFPSASLGSEPGETSDPLRGEPLLTPTTHSEIVIRRSRGYVPSPLRVPCSFKNEILACGAHLKNTFALAKGDEVIVSHHIGDIENLETLRAFEKGIEHFKRLFDIEPVIIARDLHPEYLSTRYAENLQIINPELRILSIQHHHAHIASCLADNGVSNRKLIGVSFDGTGFGTDGNIWGGEFLIADYADFQRVAHLKYVPLPGGEQAIREPWRMAASYLYETFGPEFLGLGLDFISRLDKDKWRVLERMIKQGVNSPLVSSVGRLFDAVSSLLGLRDRITYEGQAAVELEMAMEQFPSSKLEIQSYGYEIENRDQIYIIDPRSVIMGVVSDLQRGISASSISRKFHNTVVEIIVDLCKRINKREGLSEVALSGGVFQNMFLLSRAFNRLSREGFKVYLHHRVPTNDGGISLGQAVVANAKSQ